MPQSPDVLGFVAADLSGLAPPFARELRRAFRRSKPRLSHQAVSLHVPLDCGIGAERPQRGIGLHQNGEVVVVQLVAPVRIVAVLENKPLGDRRAARETLPQSLRTARRKAPTGSSCWRRAV